MTTTPRQRNAEKAGFKYSTLPLRRGKRPKQWLCPTKGTIMTVERAVLSQYEADGWRGYHREGGLILNLIKCMSFPEISPRHRMTYIEALYAQNVAFKEDYFTKATLLANLKRATPDQVKRNFEMMMSAPPPLRKSVSSLFKRPKASVPVKAPSILDWFPGLETWMLVELMEVAGVDLLHRIATIFSTDPYEFRRGWPDLTIWKDGQLRFVEVKAPGDSLGKSQRTIAQHFAIPLALEFSIVDVRVCPKF
ncbi:VRR-NUC domain-containing protein [Luteimonas arsenica]|uniref:VRR-NUC domain-containing protein n=1 Tax=Luteimonas arsenica TaxID=1586242 RepID=UPI001054C51E|nr:VRR-NUC domain-containing protein [Luteimonas arsenica]